MPNWCNNILVVSGPVDSLVRFRTRARIGHDLTDQLAGDAELVFAGSGTADHRERLVDAMSDGTTDLYLQFANLHPVPAELVAARAADDTDNQAVSDLLDWQIRNWGTKWDLSGVQMTDIDTTSDAPELTYRFDTAWSPPGEWLAHVSAQFTDLTFTMAFAEQGVGAAGIATVKDQEITAAEPDDGNESEWLTAHGFDDLWIDWQDEEDETE